MLVENVRRTGLELTSRIPKGYEGNLRKQRIKSLCDNKLTMWEDQGTNITETILNMNKHLGDAKNNQDQLNDAISKINADPAVKIQKAMNDLKTALEPLLSVIASVVGAIASWMSANPQLTATITAIVGAIGIFSGVLMALAPILYSIQTALPIITKMLPLLGNAFKAMTGPIGLAITALTLLVPVIIENWEPIKDFFAKLWDGIKQVFETTINAVASFLSSSWETIKNVTSTVWNGIKDFFSQSWNAIKQVFETTINGVSSFLTNAWNTISSTAKTVWNGIVSFFTSTWNTIKTTFQTVLTTVSNLVQTIWNGIKNTTSNVFNTIKNTISSVWNGIKSAVNSAINAVKNVVSSIWSAIKNTTSNVWNSIKNFVMNPVDAIKNAVPAAFESMKNKIASVWEKVKGVIKAPLNAIISTINSFISRLNGLKIPDWVPGVGGKGINIPKIPMLARGTNFFKGGYAIVGEQGPELVQLPTGAKVYSNGQTQDMLSNQTIITGNTFVVREEADIKKIARELYVLQIQNTRGGGIA